MSLDLEFANREAELRMLISPIHNPGAARYVQVYAPSGLGKTYLLRRAQAEYQAAGWLCAWLDFSSDERLCHQRMLVLRELGKQFGVESDRVRTCASWAEQIMRSRRQSAVFLDAVTLATGEVRRWMKTDLIPCLEERIPDPRLRPRFIAAGRYPIREWAVYSKQRFESVQLTPFNDTVVDDLLRRFAERTGHDLPDEFFQDMTEAILAITRGHPACIKRVLREIESREFAVQPAEVTQVECFDATVGTLLDEELLVLQVPEKVRGEFKSLCLLRGYTPSLLGCLASHGWIGARAYVDWDLESELLATHLVEIPNGNPLYRIEPLIRQLVALQEEYSDQETFFKLNQEAFKIFEEQAKGKDTDGNELPNRPYDRMQVAFVVEAVYHYAILLKHNRVSARNARNELRGQVRELLASRLTREDEKYWVNLLLRAVETDLELTSLIYELTGDGGLEFVLRPLYDLSGNKEG